MYQSNTMKYILLAIFFLFFGFSSLSQKPTIQWQKSYGGSFYDKAESVIQTTDGGYVIGGHSESSNYDLTINKGNFDFWIIKINNSGQIQWKNSLGGEGIDLLLQVIQTTDGGFLCVGNTNSSNADVTDSHGQIDYWVVKFSDLGTLQWKKTYGGSSNDWGYSACLASDGGYIIAGHSESNDEYVLGNHGNTDLWILKIDINGNELWQKSYGGTGYDYLSAIKKTQDGGYVMVGYSYSTDNNLPQNKGGSDIWVLKINNLGDIQWISSFGGSGYDFGRAIIEDVNGNFVVSGDTYSYDFDSIDRQDGFETSDIIAIKINNLGQKIWSRCYGGEANEYGRSIIQTYDGEYSIAGESYSTILGHPTGNHGSADYWLIKMNPANGDLIWEKTMGGVGHDEANCLVATFDNGYLVIGNSAHPISDDVTNNYGDDDFWVVKLKNSECQRNLNLVADIPLGNIEYRTLENINSQSKLLNNSSNILYSAGKSVVLSPGFKTESGAIFEAKIEGCN
jgi:hypothetical protein